MQTFPKPALFLHESDLVFDPKIRLQLFIERTIDWFNAARRLVNSITQGIFSSPILFFFIRQQGTVVLGNMRLQKSSNLQPKNNGYHCLLMRWTLSSLLESRQSLVQLTHTLSQACPLSLHCSCVMISTGQLRAKIRVVHGGTCLGPSLLLHLSLSSQKDKERESSAHVGWS